MSRRQRLIGTSLLFAGCVFADDQALWREFGLTDTQTIQQGPRTVTAYHMKDLTGALAAWQWQRTAADHACNVTPFCAQNSTRMLISEDNYLLSLDGPAITAVQLAALLKTLPNVRDTSLPAILTFIPRNGLVPNSSRYILGPESLGAFAPELSGVKPGFDEGAEAQTAQYDLGRNEHVQLAIFYYPTPEMARLHTLEFKALRNVHVKRSGVLVAMALGNANDAQANTLLSRIEYEARITWNDVPPPSPIKPMYQLLLNIMYMSIALSVLCLVAGLIYAGMRIYRRRFGSLEAEEAMTTLHLTGD
jgi:hypothetical protein